ncbi:MAG: helix-turn-helix domain-containing protein [Bacteroidia bacterium]
MNVGLKSYIISFLSLEYCRVKSTSQKDIAKKLGKKVAELRKDKNLSQADLCYEAEIDVSTLSRLERGQLNVTLSILQAISKTLSVEMKDLFDF